MKGADYRAITDDVEGVTTLVPVAAYDAGPSARHDRFFLVPAFAGLLALLGGYAWVGGGALSALNATGGARSEVLDGPASAPGVVMQKRPELNAGNAPDAGAPTLERAGDAAQEVRPRTEAKERTATEAAAAGPATEEPPPEETAVEFARAPAATPLDAARQGAIVGTHVVQVGAFPSAEEAEQGRRTAQQRLGDLLDGRRLEIERADLETLGVFYRVRVAPFSSVEQAREFCRALAQQGQDCLAMRR